MPFRNKRTDKPALSGAAAAICEALEIRRLLSTVYVDAIAPGPTNDGSSWQNAYTSLQTALGAAVSGQTIEVAQGTYTPTSGTDRTATFQLIDGVSILGGYAGYGTANPDACNVTSYPTILSGDIGVIGNNSDNSYNVVTGSGTNASAVLNGFTISDGSANAQNPDDPQNQFAGGGLYESAGSPTIANCTFTGNSAAEGGGMFNEDSSSPTLTNCTFTGNTVAWGGGMFNYESSSPTLTNCEFTGNSADEGSGMFNEYSSSPTLLNCTFTENSAGSYGGGMYNYGSSLPTLTNCTFTTNSAYEGGGMSNENYSSPTLTNCTFTGNVDNGYGGGMSNFLNCSPTLTNCTFTTNSAIVEGGGMYVEDCTSITLTNCTFTANSAYAGGGLYNEVASSLMLTSCTFTGNHATNGDGGGIFNSSVSPTLTNCTFNENFATNGNGGGMCSYFSTPTLTNCILWGDTAPVSSEIYNDSTGQPIVDYSDIQGGYAGTGNINADPLFVNAAAGNLQLQPTSPCINVGSNAAINATGVTTDLAGNPRIIDGVVDMGAYGCQSPSIAWTGSGDGINWGNPANWSDDLVPTQNDTVMIPSGATVQLGSGTFAVASLTLQGNATLNLGSGTLEIDFGDAADPLAMMQSYIQSGFSNDAWTGSGITSSIAQSNPGLYAIGYADGNDDVGTPAVAGQIYMQATVVGDATLDGIVNFPDLLLVAQNYGKTGQDWAHGDFNYDGIVNFPDLLLVAQNYGKQMSAEQTAQLPNSFSEQADTSSPVVACNPVPSSPVSSPINVVNTPPPPPVVAEAVVSAPISSTTIAPVQPPVEAASAVAAETPIAGNRDRTFKGSGDVSTATINNNRMKVRVGSGHDSLSIARGVPTILGSGWNDTLAAMNTAADALQGGAGNDSLLGNGAAGESLNGGSGSDIILLSK
jgi:parallel beta-helix repeat protein